MSKKKKTAFIVRGNDDNGYSIWNGSGTGYNFYRTVGEHELVVNLPNNKANAQLIASLLNDHFGGEWSKDPPDKPGWYWIRDGDGEREPIHVLRHGGKLFAEMGRYAAALDVIYGEWWSIPIGGPPP